MATVHDAIINKLQDHSEFDDADRTAIRALPHWERTLAPNEDVVRQGDKPKAAVVVIAGVVARYHTLRSGRRQYLSLHIAGDMPDAQAMFLETMDHAVCALGQAAVSLIPHDSLLALFKAQPNAGAAIWRETLIDAAIFREAITNNSARPLPTRMAHFFCEQYYRARAGGHAQAGACRLPLTQVQLGEVLGASLPSINRALRALRRTRTMTFEGGELRINDWARMAELGDFNAGYLRARKVRRL